MAPTNPAAGVMATKPATAPEAAPNIEGLPLITHSPTVHDTTAAAVANKVLRNANAAEPFASNAEPALKPNQPTHNKVAPTIVNVSECGANSFEIGICGEGKSDGLGAVIDNVKLFNLDECQYNIM
jgi:hypothetical protein